MQGTFTQPMPYGRGGTIAPTGKAFALDMIIVGIWNRQSPPFAELAGARSPQR